jgi:hypothetical protein
MGNNFESMIFPSAITSLAAAIVLMPAPMLVCWKVYKGSKSTFAYTLMAFTFVDGVQYLANAIILS